MIFPTNNLIPKNYFYIDNILFFIKSVQNNKIIIDLNYIYLEENIMEYMERSSLDAHYYNATMFKNNRLNLSLKKVLVHIQGKISTFDFNSLPTIRPLENIPNIIGGSTEYNKLKYNGLIDYMYKRLTKFDGIKYTIEPPNSVISDLL